MTHEPNGIKPLLRTELIALILQFVILVGGMVYSYASLNTELRNVRESIRAHIDQQETFVSKEVWSTRNEFIDAKLDAMDRKLDRLLMFNSLSYDDLVKMGMAPKKVAK